MLKAYILSKAFVPDLWITSISIFRLSLVSRTCRKLYRLVFLLIVETSEFRPNFSAPLLISFCTKREISAIHSTFDVIVRKKKKNSSQQNPKNRLIISGIVTIKPRRLMTPNYGFNFRYFNSSLLVPRSCLGAKKETRSQLLFEPWLCIKLRFTPVFSTHHLFATRFPTASLFSLSFSLRVVSNDWSWAAKWTLLLVTS